GIGYSEPRIVPTEKDLERAARVLNEGSRVAMLVGAGALHAGDEVMQAANILSAGVAKALLGKAVIPDSVPYCTGAIGLLGTRPTYDMIMQCDTLLMVGTSFPYSEFLPREGQARGVQIDIKSRMLSLRYPMEVPLHGDSKLTLQALIPLLKPKHNMGWRRMIEREVAGWWELMEARAHIPAKPINPQYLFWELSPRLPDHSIITCDSGTCANWFARDLKIREGMMASLSGGLATMCPALPYALAAKVNYPNRPVIACVGDGAMQMLGNEVLVTATRLWRNWPDPRFLVCILHNNDLNQVTWEQRVMEGDPKFKASQDLPDFPFAQYAELLGMRGIRVDHAEDVPDALDDALAADRPVVLDVLTDPDVPPLPPHIKFEQARKYMSAIVHGDPDTYGIVRQSALGFFEPLLAETFRGKP
ncbi:MAG: thiamine pyrophosphate-dependent enzyme, partial [Candidatus Hydrogenedentes bacterium]|nr:thiamine pyrophosphate-dependent enzyme [Candidatus Hydrogenedentota bacterium]